MELSASATDFSEWEERGRVSLANKGLLVWVRVPRLKEAVEVEGADFPEPGNVDRFMVSDVLAPEPYVFLCLRVTKLNHCFHTSLAFSLRKPWNISISKPCAPTNRVKMTWNPIVIPITRVLVASSPSPHPKPNTSERVRAMTTFCLMARSLLPLSPKVAACLWVWRKMEARMMTNMTQLKR